MTRKKFDKHNYDEHELERRERKDRRSFWLYIGVGILILLLIVWLTIASLWEDTDVAAAILPFV